MTGELRDSNTTVNLEDCVVHLGSGADVTLNNVTVTGGILNLHDRDTDRARNVVRLQRVTFDSRAVLIELNDADDEFRAERLEATVAEGWSLQVAETDDDANEGGSVRLVSSTVLATGTDAPVTVTASEHSGTVELVNTTLDTRGLLLVTAADCSARIRGNALDCSTDALVADVAGP
ncbi:MAG: hypothetical protein U5K29_00340 [Acidimicrobiales bacterium]|nr:hypothetical protein [Acidimicrobiales bacterium]